MQAYLFPGQGSQRVGMGDGLFEAFPELTEAADAVLGYSIAELCLRDPERRLTRTQFTQPALYVVNALSHRRRLQETGAQPDFVAGHSLGEYNALECAGAVGFEDGLKLVRQRGELMAAAPKGTMAAVVGLPAGRIAEILAENGLEALDVANFNAPAQTILSGLEPDIRAAQDCFERNGATYIPLNVGGAFHSRYMRPAGEAFAAFLAEFTFAEPQIPVVANVDAQPYRSGETARRLADQLTQPVRWLDSVRFLLSEGVTDFLELGPGDVLTKLVRGIRSDFEANPPAPAASAPELEPEARPDAQATVAAWNRRHPVGTRVTVAGYERALTTKTPAVVLFGHRAAVYLEGYNGYFALEEVAPAAPAEAGA